MKAIVHRKFGSTAFLSCGALPKPTPREKEVLIRVKAASVNPLDWHMLRGTPRIIRFSDDLRRYKPMRPGRDVAGEVEALGAEVRLFRPGDAVFGASQGAFAEYLCGSESDFVAKPPGLSFEDAAALSIAGLTALQGLRDAGGLRPGHQLLVNGASGGIGTFAVQLGRILGAEVTGVCAADAAERVRRIGADHVVDYRSEDFTQASRRYDLILDLIGNHSFGRLRRVLAPEGRIVLVGGGGRGGHRLGRWLIRAGVAMLASRLSRRDLRFCMSRLSVEDLAMLAALVEEGKLKPVIDRHYSLEDVPAAMRYVAEGHARGKVIIDVAA